MSISERLVKVVRRYVRTEDGIVPLDVELGSVGLDSMGAINLLMDLESEFDLVFPDELLNEETFKTTGTLQASIEKLLQSTS